MGYLILKLLLLKKDNDSIESVAGRIRVSILGLFSLFNGISTFVGYLKPNPSL